MTNLLIFASLLALFHVASADLLCHSPFYENYFNVSRATLYEDCRILLSHLPSLTKSLGSNPYHRRLSSSSPFFPQASFTHRTCVIKITCYGDRPSHTAQAAQNGLESLSDAWLEYDPALITQMPLSEPIVMKIWNEARGSAYRVVEHCIANGHSGMDWASFTFPQASTAWWSVDVRAVAANALWDRLARMDATFAISGKLPPRYKVVKDTFRETFNDVD